MEKNNRTVRAIGFVTVVTLAAKVMGVVREALQANAFGTTPQFDLYSTAYNHSIYLFTTLAYALCVAAVPIITKKLAEGREPAERVAGNLISVCLVLSFLLCGAGFLLIRFAPLGRWLSVDGEDLGKLLTYLRICLLTLPLIVLIYLMVSVFQSMGHYSLQGSMSLPYNLALILFLALFASKERMTEYVLAVCIAWILQLVWLLPCAAKERFLIRPSLRLKDPDLRLFGRTALVTLFTTSIFLWCYLADANTVSSFGEGAVSAVYYADKLFTPISTTLIYSISVVLFPKFNEEYTRASEERYKNYVGKTLGNTLFVILPFSVLFSAFSLPIIRVLFERGSFDASSSAVTASVLSMYALGMAGFCVLDLINKAYYTMRKTLAPMLINAAALALNLVLNLLLSSRGSAGLIALATTASLTVAGVIALICFFRRTKDAFTVSRLLKQIACAAVMGALAYFCATALSGLIQNKLLMIAVYAAIGLIGLVIYGLLCWLLHDREAIQTLFRHFRKERN